MDLTKKSMKWLVAVFVVFAMLLTAVFAVGNVAATASANENEQDATVHLWVTDSAALGTYPNLIRSAAQRTITVDYGFEITEDSDFSIFAISPVLIYGDSDPVKPTEITLNPAFSSIVAFEYADSNAGGYLANNGATAFTVDLTDEDAKSTDLNAYVNDEWDSAKYLFRATYVISANAYGVYELSFGANTAFTLESGSYYLPEIENGDFAINAPIAVPTPADVTYTYDGTLKTFQWSGTVDSHIAITGDQETYADTYTVNVSLQEGYAWDEEGYPTAGKTFPFVINKKEIPVPTPVMNLVYTGETLLGVDYTGIEDGEIQFVEDAGNAYQAYEGVNAGNYTAVYELTDNSNTKWEGTNEDTVSINWSIAKVQITKPTPYGSNQYVYDSYNKQFMLDVVSAETGYYTISNNIRRNAGSQTVTVSLKDKTNTEWADGTTTNLEFTLTVQQRPVNLSVSADAASHVYGNTPANVSISATGVIDAFSCSYKVVCVDGEAPYAEYTPTQFNAGLNAGHYTLNPVYNDINGNYDVTVSEPFSYEVIKREITIPTAVSGLRYTGSAQVGVTKTDGSYYDLVAGGTEAATAVGNYTATYALKSTTNTYWAGNVDDVANKTVNWSIGRAQITKPSIEVDVKTYNGSAQTYSGSGTGYTFTGSGTNFGTYPVTVSLTDTTTTEWNDGTTADYDVADRLSITKKAVTLDFYDSDAEEPWHLTFVTTYPDSMYYITVKATGLIGANDLGELGFIATNDMTHAVADITVEGAPAGYYTLTPTYTPNANYDVTALQGTARIYVRDVPVPVVVTDTYNYDGTAKAIVFDEVTSQGYTQYYTITGNSLTEPGTTTVTVALKDEYAGNVIWGYDENVDEYLDTTDDQTFTLTVNAVNVDVKFSVTTGANNTTYYYNYVNNALVATTENEWVAASFDVRDALPAYPTYSFFHTAGWKSGNNVVTAVTAAMSGETQILNAHYIYNVGAGDVDGDGLVTTRDLIKMKRYYIGLETEVLEDAAAAWAAAIADTAEAPVFVSALDANGSGAFRINDLVTIREALATGYDFRIVVGRQGVTGQSIENVQVLTVYEYDEFVAAVKTGIPVKFGANITAEDARFDELLDIPVDIDLNGKALTVEYFGLNSNANDVTLSIKGGTIYAFDDIVITAPNGNVKLDNVTGYNYVTDEVILAAASNSLHFDRVVEFLKYPEGSAMFADKIAALNAIAALSSENEQEQAAAVAEFNTATKAEVSIPVDTHVVVEENASLEVKQITVVAASNQEVETKTFSVSVKNDQASVIKVDISEVKEVVEQVNVYHVDEVALEGNTDKVEIVKAADQEVATVAEDPTYTVAIDNGTSIVFYADLDAAVAAAQNGDTIVLLQDVTYSTTRNVEIVEMKAFDIDLNGKTFTTNSTQERFWASAICYGDNENTSPARNVKVYNGTIVTAYATGVYIDGAATATLEDLTVNAATVGNQADPEYSAAIRTTTQGTVIINNGTYTGTKAIAVSNSGGYVTINGGSFSGALYIAKNTNNGLTAADKIITINGGTFTNVVFEKLGTGTIAIYGGTFDADPSAYVADGYAATEDNGIWTVAPAGAARIGSTVYQTVQAAINAAQDGDTIVLLADVTDGTGLMTEDSAPKTLTIDFNGKTYTVVGGAVGSSGTLTQAMHWSAGSDITLTNGTLTVSSAVNAAGVRMSMQNHGDLTVSNMVMNLDGITVTNYGTYTGDDAKFSGLERPQFCTNDNASIAIVNSTLNFPSNSNFGVYNESTNASIVNSTINGTVALSTGPTTDTASITIDSASTVTGGVVGYFAYDLVTEKNGTHTVKQGGARIGSTYYADVKAALNAAQANDTVVITANNALGAAVATYPAAAQGNVTIDLAGHSVNGGSMGVIKNSSAYELTIVDTVGGGSVNGTGNYTLYNSGTGAITLNSGSITNTTASGTRIAVYNSSTGTFNMNGGSISGGKIAVKNSSTGTVNLYGGTLSGYWVVINADAGTINLDGATITSVACSDDSGIESQKNGVVNVISGSITARTGIATWNKVGNDAAVNVTGGTITSSHICISTNGNDTYATSINVSGGTLVSGECGIYNAGMGNVTVSGTASITGVNSGIETRAGVLTVTGGTITSTADTVLVEANGNGTTTTGAGIAVIQHTTKQAVTVSVTGGTITGVDAILEANPQNNSDADLALISITIGADATLVGDVVITDEAKITYTNNQNA